MLEHTDEHVIAQQLGRSPRGAVSVAARCPAGHPSVITCYPLVSRGKRVIPFPTLYWLICPTLCRQVACLERDGAIARIGVELGQDPSLQSGLRRNHEQYIASRWAALSTDDQTLVSNCRLGDEFQRRGIGGMTNFIAIKCLHLHLAHHLVAGNVIGELMINRYGLQPCGSEVA